MTSLTANRPTAGEPPRGMKTNGIGQFCDWLNHDRSMAEAPMFFSTIGGLPRADGYEPGRPGRYEFMTIQGSRK